MLFFFFFLPIFVFGFLSNLMSPSQGAFFIYLLEMERMAGRALYSSMLCFMMRLHSKALMPFGQVSFCTSVVLSYIFFFLSFFFVFFFPLPFLLPPSCWPPFIFLSLCQIILPGFRNKFIFCKRILLYQVLHPH